MMKFRTEIEIPKAPWQIGYGDKIAMLGSCFSDNIARKLGEYYFQVTANPTGTLYNPVSIARHMEDPEVREADVFIITFGTAWVYIDKQTSAVVDNCQKRPASDFVRRRLTVDEIVNLWQPIIDAQPDKHFIFTVSPIRHLKDGLHENNLSKGILLLAIERLTAAAASTSQPVYFPAYELLLDELRDYRFYSDDMMHPSPVAISYIWERFTAAFISSATQTEMRELYALWLNRQHRSLHPGSEEDLTFQSRLAAQLSDIQTRYPWVK